MPAYAYEHVAMYYWCQYLQQHKSWEEKNRVGYKYVEYKDLSDEYLMCPDDTSDEE